MCEQKVGMFFFGDDHVFFPQKILALPFVWCSFKHFQKNLGPAKGLWDSKMGKGKPPAKAMKVKNVTLKRPAALNLGTLKDKNQPMSLEEKMESFGKKGNQDVQQFLDSLTKNQREALWQRFASARAALRDSTADDLWQSVAKGKGSDPQKKKLLGCFLQLGGDLKTKKDHYMKELVSYSKTFGFLAAKIYFVFTFHLPIWLRQHQLPRMGSIPDHTQKVWPSRMHETSHWAA